MWFLIPVKAAVQVLVLPECVSSSILSNVKYRIIFVFMDKFTGFAHKLSRIEGHCAEIHSYVGNCCVNDVSELYDKYVSKAQKSLHKQKTDTKVGNI